jgi:hypothetical protein
VKLQDVSVELWLLLEVEWKTVVEQEVVLDSGRTQVVQEKTNVEELVYELSFWGS